jgi:hypothetical protein
MPWWRAKFIGTPHQREGEHCSGVCDGTGWVVTKVLRSLWQGQALYGALGSFVLFLVWSYANAWVLLICGQLPGVLLRSGGTRGEAR